ncbi:methyltransferase domain-containing protein [Flammeovirga yaeyamensis]|uniref:Methyltransferase domain-containing protein n=1 Tax=Flammeovirga yaeyamensis TaxID=367791 RepID=A0AAX1N6J2_9BACT|nr:methyltransferase domain-containing protein [Flammeovirga yaeyamensis]MBB3697672.1 thiopurine S-methyltransferase [Flammeovirga yaeyamensis]NMF35968.1 methyltransferase domain-containing protein [Flammeovirga yaeyamensis]QWG03085.1 methyltransferase domain-containing protein [Flammeovirga yaeyamensis]
MNKKEFWDNKYLNNKTGWDIGYASTPLVKYFDQISDKDLFILIPGVGNGYELEYLWKAGFKNVYAIDFSEKPIKNFLDRNPDFPEKQIICNDFFEWSISIKFDLIIEQTFFCAIPPALRKQYVKQTYRLLSEQGKISGLMFTFPLTESGPPFGGSIEEYQGLFREKFTIRKMEECYNSIPPRQGNELFVILEKKID